MDASTAAGTAPTIDVSALVDRSKISPFNLKLLFWSFLIMMLDGYDIGAAAFAAPELVRQWHVERAALGPVLSASLFGIFFGALGFGYLGDRHGRKPAIVAASLVFGGFTLAAVFASNLEQLMWLRILAGIGIGGVLPNTVALNAELSPKRLRATLVVIMFTGVSFGGALPGFVSLWLVPQHGWQILFWIGGVLPLVIAAALVFALPESIKFLALHERRAETARLARILDRDVAIGPQTRFIVTGSEQHERFRLPQLFRGSLAVVTPLLWLLFAINLMTFYFINSWMPILIEAAGAPPGRATFATSLFQFGGTIGGIALSRLLDRQGLKPVAWMFALAVPVVASIGHLATSETPLLAAAFLAGFCLLGLQFGLNASSGLIYPTSIRANGVGWALGIGRIGAVSGPMVGGIIIGMHLPIGQLYMVAATPLIVAAVACFVLIRICDTRASSSA